MKQKNNSLKAKALYFLARRDYAYQELFNKLKKYSEDYDEITSVLRELAAKNYLSEERFIKNYLSSKSSKYGLLKIRHNLYQKAADTKLVEQILHETQIDEVSAAKEIWRKKFGSVAADKTELARQIRFLQNRGFSPGVIRQIVKLAENLE